MKLSHPISTLHVSVCLSVCPSVRSSVSLPASVRLSVHDQNLINFSVCPVWISVRGVQRFLVCANTSTIWPYFLASFISSSCSHSLNWIRCTTRGSNCSFPHFHGAPLQVPGEVFSLSKSSLNPFPQLTVTFLQLNRRKSCCYITMFIYSTDITLLCQIFLTKT